MHMVARWLGDGVAEGFEVFQVYMRSGTPVYATMRRV